MRFIAQYHVVLALHLIWIGKKKSIVLTSQQQFSHKQTGKILANQNWMISLKQGIKWY